MIVGAVRLESTVLGIDTLLVVVDGGAVLEAFKDRLVRGGRCQRFGRHPEILPLPRHLHRRRLWLNLLFTLYR